MLPPVYVLIYLIISIGLHYLYPIARISPYPYSQAGYLFIAVALYLILGANYLFRKSGTTIKPFEKPTSLSTNGPYKFTRNPMYLGITMALIGVAVLMGSAASFFAPIAFPITMSFVFIPVEEKNLAKSFGDEYRDYCGRVRRWL